MANNLQLSNANVNAKGAAGLARLNSGYIRIYDGAQPATADTAVGAQVLLAELRWNATAFGAGTAGVFSAGAITADSSANATGTPAWFRALGSDGATVEFDGTAGAAGCDLNLSGLVGGQIIMGGTVSVSSFQYTETK